VTALLDHLTKARRERKLLVPYVVAGTPEPTAFASTLETVGRFADAVEVGIPYSDPLMDGPVIAAASERSIRAGVTPLRAIELSGQARTDAPMLAMTYYNPIHRIGEKEFCARAAEAGFAGLIVPDLPVEESTSLRQAAAESGLAWVPLVAPTSSEERVAAIGASATGFVYAVSTLGVTGARESLSERAAAVVRACRKATDLPVLVGIGISTPEQAAEAAAEADGVVIGSAIVSRVQESGLQEVVRFLAQVRERLDSVSA
jgi:tryptophan synthase alpha chain